MYTDSVPPASLNFYPRSPCGERHLNLDWILETLKFLSTLSLRRATPMTERIVAGLEFLSTLSLRRATAALHVIQCGIYISIHALLAESDRPDILPSRYRNRHFYPRSPCGERPDPVCRSSRPLYFYPRSPCGERRQYSRFRTAHTEFLSTLSLRRATHFLPAQTRPCYISIHALLAESDSRLRLIVS